MLQALFSGVRVDLHLSSYYRAAQRNRSRSDTAYATRVPERALILCETYTRARARARTWCVQQIFPRALPQGNVISPRKSALCVTRPRDTNGRLKIVKTLYMLAAIRINDSRARHSGKQEPWCICVCVSYKLSPARVTCARLDRKVQPGKGAPARGSDSGYFLRPRNSRSGVFCEALRSIKATLAFAGNVRGNGCYEI